MSSLQAIGVIALFVFVIVPLFGLFCIPKSRATAWWLGLINLAIYFVGYAFIGLAVGVLLLAIVTLLG